MNSCTAAHSRPCAAISQHVRIACLLHVRRRCTALFFLAQLCKHRLASVSRLLTVSVQERWSTGLSPLLAERNRSSARTCRLLSSRCDPMREERTTDQQHVVASVIAGRVSAESQVASQGQWSETAQRRLCTPLQPCCGFVVGVGTCVILCCTHRALLREIIAAAGQIKPLRGKNLWSVVGL